MTLFHDGALYCSEDRKIMEHCRAKHVQENLRGNPVMFLCDFTEISY